MSEVKDSPVNERAISSMIPYSHHVDDGVIATKNGEYIAVIKLDGRSHFAAELETVERWVYDLNNKFKAIAKENVALWSHMVRRKVDEYPEKHYDNVFCAELDKEYKNSFKDYSMLVNEYYITIVYRPVVGMGNNFFAKFEKLKLADKISQQEAYIEEINRITDQMMGALKTYSPERLGVYMHNDRPFSELLEFFRYLITRDRSRVPVTREKFCNYLANSRPLFSEHRNMGELRKYSNQKGEYFGIYDLKEYDNMTISGHLNILMENASEFILTQSFSCLSKIASKGYLQRHQKLLIDSQDVAVSQIEEINEALDQLVSGDFVMGEHHMTITVFGDGAKETMSKLQTIEDSFTDVGMIPTPCDMALEGAFFGQLPANFKWRTRPAVITSQNWWCFNSLHNFASGKPTGNPWGSAITLFKTTSGTPNFFNLHVSGDDSDDFGKKLLGNTMIIGQSSAGKTTVLNFILAQMQDKKPRLVTFDKDRGMEIFIRAIGGNYNALEAGKPSGFNPFQTCSREFIKEFLVHLLDLDGYGVNHFDDVELEKALNTIEGHPIQNRRLSVLLQALPNPISNDTRPTVAARLQKWCEGGQYGWCFDNPIDTLDVTANSIFGFDVTEFLELPTIRAPMMMYLIHRTEKMIDGTRFVYVFDEFWKMLEDYYFKKLVKDKLKTIRKQNGLCIFATQEPEDALSSDISSTLVSQVATLLLLQNQKADYDDYVKGLKVTPEEYEIVKNIAEGSREFLIKQGDNTSQAVFNLRGMNKELLVLSGTPDNALIVNDIIDKLGDNDVNKWLPEFWQRNGISFNGFN